MRRPAASTGPLAGFQWALRRGRYSSRGVLGPALAQPAITEMEPHSVCVLRRGCARPPRTKVGSSRNLWPKNTLAVLAQIGIILPCSNAHAFAEVHLNAGGNSPRSVRYTDAPHITALDRPLKARLTPR